MEAPNAVRRIQAQDSLRTNIRRLQESARLPEYQRAMLSQMDHDLTVLLEEFERGLYAESEMRAM